MNAVVLLQIKGLWKSIMRKKQLGAESLDHVLNARLHLVDTISQVYVLHVRKMLA
jgi:hypothetical protein